MEKKLIGTAVLLVLVVFGIFGMLDARAADPVQAGVAAAVKGEVKATTPPDPAARILKSGDKIFMGDKIETGAAGQLQVLLLDETVFTLGPLSAITVDEFVYDPSNDNGKVKASVAKGIFRVVSGKVAHKKPENMSVDLPAGAIGFRGTNVAGIIDGAKSTIVLLGPVGVGRISVTNIVNGEIITVDIDEAGYATIVGGPNSAPVPVFQISEADLNRIAGALGQGMSAGGAGTSGLDTGVTPSSGTPVDTQTLLNLLNTVDSLNQTSMTAAQDKAQESASEHNESSGSGGESGYKYTVGE